MLTAQHPQPVNNHRKETTIVKVVSCRKQLTRVVVLLLAVSVWCFCRFYYFAFYVIEHYVDSNYRFAGLWSFAGYLWSRRRKAGPSARKPSE